MPCTNALHLVAADSQSRFACRSLRMARRGSSASAPCHRNIHIRRCELGQNAEFDAVASVGAAELADGA